MKIVVGNICMTHFLLLYRHFIVTFLQNMPLEVSRKVRRIWN
jgi:hypothetical protein